ALAERDYPKEFPQALDHVVLFLPAESLFSAALEGDRELLMWAAARNILLATPASLIALLRSVSVSWQQHEQSANAREIAAAARELYERVAKFTDHFGRIRDGLEKTVRSYNEAVGSYESRVRPGGERLLKLGGGTESKPLAVAEPLEGSLRLPPVAE
ncbi:MAG TPA: DNA recombination protein RmuC, partial [Candidatus Limnocylindria bacterium]|nr:DNA recombination protein RmuC [Candidatus Limnocylindria bacterium]